MKRNISAKAAAQRKMKPSGVDWIGDVPEGWQARRIKYLVGGEGTVFMDGDWINSGIIVEDGVRYLTSGNVGVGVFKRQGNGHITEETFKELNCLKALPGDLMLCRLNEPLGRGCIIPDDEPCYVIAVDNVILRPEKEYDKRFIMHCVSCDRFSMAALIAASGATMQRISRNDLGRLSIPIPPLDEQKRIAAKLDRLCGRVDELAENLKGEIAALQEYRKSLITECVTKGLNPKAKMKPSGVDWIGKVPVGWTVMRLKYACSTITDGSHFSPECVDDGYPYVTATDVRGLGIDFERTKFVSEVDYQALVAAGCGLKCGDVLMVKDGATTGRVGMMTDDTEAVALSSVAILRTPEDIDRKFLYWGLQSDGLQRNIQQTMAGSAMPRITVWKLKQYNIALPLLDEQKEIAAFLDKRCAVVDAKIAERQRQLEKLGEYRSSVIYEYVTGKREAAVDESSNE